MFDRAFGKPKQEIENIGPDGGPISFVIRAPSVVSSTEEWLRIYAPKTINGEVETEVEDAAPPARPSPLAAPVEPVAQPSTSPTTTAWLDTHGPNATTAELTSDLGGSAAHPAVGSARRGVRIVLIGRTSKPGGAGTSWLSNTPAKSVACA
jgi:hypothetical protein